MKPAVVGAKRCVFIEKKDTSWKNGHVLENKGEIYFSCWDE
jgi:hypothetical protein